MKQNTAIYFESCSNRIRMFYKIGASDIFGLEVAGEIVKIGEATESEFNVGDKVYKIALSLCL